MTDEKREYACSLIQYINHRLRTPLSVVVHELELMKCRGDEEADVALKRAREISSLLSDFTKLLSDEEARSEVSLALLLAPALKLLSDIACSGDIKVNVRPTQARSAFYEFLNFFCAKSQVTKGATLRAEGNTLLFKAEFSEPKSIGENAFDSLTAFSAKYFRVTSPILSLLDEVFKANSVSLFIEATDLALTISFRFSYE